MTDRTRSLIFANIVISCIATSMLSTAMTTALPAVISDIGVDVSLGQWLTSGYSLIMAICMPLTAFLITRFPTRRLYLAALGLSALGMALNAVAPSFAFMMVARALQAAGNGILSSMAQVILLTIYPAEKRGSAMGWYGLSVSAAPVVAPTIAGIIVDGIGWRAIFLGALLIIAVSTTWAFRCFEDVLETHRKGFDIPSFILSALAFGGITLGIGGVSNPAGRTLAMAELAIGIAAGGMFAHRQLHLEEPLLELRCLRQRPFTVAVISSMLLYLVMMGSSTILPLYVQNILGKPATASGLMMLPGSLAMAVISPFAGRIYDALGMRVLSIVGGTCLLLSNLGMMGIGLDTPLTVTAALNVVRSISIGCLMMPLVTWGNSALDIRYTAHGTALLTSLRTVAGAIGSALFVSLMDSLGQTGGGGAQAMMDGLNATFGFMSLGAGGLLALGVMFVSPRRKRHPRG